MNGRGRPFDNTGRGSATWIAGEAHVSNTVPGLLDHALEVAADGWTIVWNAG